MAEEDHPAAVAVIPKFDMPHHRSTLTSADVESIAKGYVIPLDLHPREALGGYTYDLDSIWEGTRQDYNFTRSGFKNARIVPGDGVAISSNAVRTYKRRRQNYTQRDINYAAGGNLMGLSAKEAWETIEDCVQCDKQWKTPTSTISDQTIATLKDQLVGSEVIRVKIPRCMQWLDAYDEPIGDIDIIEDEAENPSPQSTSQVLPSFEVYILPVTYPKGVEETIGIPIEVEPLDQMKLEDLGLNTCNHDIPLRFREVPSFDEPEPQPNPLPNCPPSDTSQEIKEAPNHPSNHIVWIVLG
ncbi:hypothetical protein Tco_0179183 [Tanacetum coccineum]